MLQSSQRMRTDQIEDVVNEVSDRDWTWWPFLFLRPEKNVDLSLARVVSVSVLYGLPASVLLAFGVFFARGPSTSEVLTAASAFPLLFLFIGSVIVAPMWNRRADRLRARAASDWSTKTT